MTAISFETRVDPLEANRAIIGTTLNNRIIKFLLRVDETRPTSQSDGARNEKRAEAL